MGKRRKVGKCRRLAIFNFDQWTCHLCGIRVRLWPHRDGFIPPDDAATIDHVVPFSLGGGNGTANLKTCCYKCNRTKGNKTEGEPRKKGRGIMKWARLNCSTASSPA